MSEEDIDWKARALEATVRADEAQRCLFIRRISDEAADGVDL